MSSNIYSFFIAPVLFSTKSRQIFFGLKKKLGRRWRRHHRRRRRCRRRRRRRRFLMLVMTTFEKQSYD